MLFRSEEIERKQQKLQLIRIACIMTNHVPIEWENILIKPKKEKISEIGEEGSMTGQVEVRTKVFRKCILRQDCYEVLAVYHSE